ncbi:unnamed protein product [Rhizoctonia solani]|uniref:Uncharacterized protein n=1 Tax=Rhizoctonia solani TaxID=456999 RepID=A0A8H3DUT3_9AGAM|nr:unnamed protein product [Rhizoctonia solani]
MYEELYSNMVESIQKANKMGYTENNVIPLDKGLGALHVIGDIGRETSSEKVTRMASGVTLQTLRDMLDIAWYKGPVAFLTEPDLARGCIKLMANVNPNGDKSTSPFSYEYGYLCFRIAAIAIMLCLTEPLLDSAIEEYVSELRSGELHVLKLFARVVADFVHRQVLSAPKNKTFKERDMIVPFQEAQSLLHIIWTDRDLFLRVVLETYTPGLTGVMYLLWQMWHVGRQRSSDNELPLGVPLFDILWRYSWGMFDDQARASVALVNDIHFLRVPWIEQTHCFDMRDSKVLTDGYVRRLANPATRPHISSITAFLPFVANLAYPGSEDTSSIFAATISYLWDKVEDKQQLDGGEIGNIFVVFHLLLQLLETMPETAHSTMQTLVRKLLKTELIGLVARLIVLRRSAAYQSDDDEEDHDHQCFKKIKQLFLKLYLKIPRNIILDISTKSTGDQSRFLDYMKWCSEILGSSGANRQYCDAGGELWTLMVKVLSPGAEISTLSHSSVECYYTRCSSPVVIPSMLFICSERGKAYCSFRCQTM